MPRSVPRPKIIGRAVDIPAVTTVVAVLIGGGLLGMIGALVAISVAAAAIQLMCEVLSARSSRIGEARLYRSNARVGHCDPGYTRQSDEGRRPPVGPRARGTERFVVRAKLRRTNLSLGDRALCLGMGSSHDAVLARVDVCHRSYPR